MSAPLLPLRFRGPWPADVIQKVAGRFSDRFSVLPTDRDAEHRLVPVSDITAMISAVAAVFSVSWAVWTHFSAKTRDSEGPPPTIPDLNKALRQDGVYDATIESVEVLARQPFTMEVIVCAKYTKNTYSFQIRHESDALDIEMRR